MFFNMCMPPFSLHIIADTLPISRSFSWVLCPVACPVFGLTVPQQLMCYCKVLVEETVHAHF